MAGVPGVIAVADPVRLGGSASSLRFGEKDHRPGWRGNRYLMLDGREAFELTFWCGTCPFLFQRQQGATRALSPREMTDRLSRGLSGVDASVVTAAGTLLPEGEYLPVLTEIRPRLVMPGVLVTTSPPSRCGPGGLNDFWGLPEYPRTAYYRGADALAGPAACLFEFIVPMVPPSWNDERQVAGYAERMSGGDVPACLAVAVLDICRPATASPGAAEPDLAHWGASAFPARRAPQDASRLAGRPPSPALDPACHRSQSRSPRGCPHRPRRLGERVIQ